VSDLRYGNVIEYEGRKWVVLDTEVHMRGRSHTTYTLELKDNQSGSKKAIKVRAEDKMDRSRPALSVAAPIPLGRLTC
jgi:translation elongation factor P/translation initiation factor 5A